MDCETPVTWWSMLVSWFPFILLIVFWIYFMRKIGGGKQAQYLDRSLVFMERQEQLLERIAVALERGKTSG